ncbi:MAG: stage V sporulation protein AC [Eubacteriales bacterium]|nr:stage V sporulation protein AC [Eubacteriales bacterium]
MESDIVDIEKRNQQYNEYVKEVTPKASCLIHCIKAFITGGIICCIGQAVNMLYMNNGISKDNAALWTTITLVGISVILTGFGIYPLITTWGGAGSLVPITGFANGVAAPAIEFKKEGQVFGIGTRIFQIGGPVILYGIFTAWVLGLIYVIFKAFGLL